MSSYSLTEALLRKEQWLISLILLFIILIAWWYLLLGAGTNMDTIAMSRWHIIGTDQLQPFKQVWDIEYCLIMLIMWWVMMIGMMLPSAAPVILLFALVYRNERKQQNLPADNLPIFFFLIGYLLIWLVYSLLAVLFQYWLESIDHLHGMMMWLTNYKIASIVIIFAGIYQFTPLKNRCLQHCHNPTEFILQHYHDNNSGGLKMGIIHGSYCLGCCWGLMLLLFVGGIMNLVWIAGISSFVLIEKLIKRPEYLSNLTGTILMTVGGYFLIFHEA